MWSAEFGVRSLAPDTIHRSIVTNYVQLAKGADLSMG